MKTIGQVEKDDYCNKVLTKHWPNVKRYEDIYECGKHNLERVDLICGGFPCQPFSQAGKRRGEKDDRYLWPEMVRIISELKPDWVIGENVVGILNMGFEDMLSSLGDIGYEIEVFVIPACAVDAKHRRDRVWIVAHNDSIRRQRSQNDRDYRNVEFQGFEILRNAEEQTRIGEAFADSDRTGDRTRTDRTNEDRQEEKQEQGDESQFESSGYGEDVPNPKETGLEGQESEGWSRKHYGLSAECSKWPIEPAMGRVANGVPRRVDRLKCLGNAVVPQIPEILGRAIMEIDMFREKKVAV